MHQVIKIILETSPADLDGLLLLEYLHANPPEIEELYALAPAIQDAVGELDAIAIETRRLVGQCKTLKPIPSQLIPPGF